MTAIKLWLDLAVAGIWPMIWHWGLGVGIIIVCLGCAFFSSFIPVIGTWLGGIRKDLEWIAACTAIFLMAEAIGAHDEALHCAAKAVVIDKDVTKVVQDTETPRAEKASDPYDNPEN